MLLRNGIVSRVWIPPSELRDQREILRLRMGLVRVKTQLKNRIHRVAEANRCTHPARPYIVIGCVFRTNYAALLDRFDHNRLLAVSTISVRGSRLEAASCHH
jgi:hypothetical protein